VAEQLDLDSRASDCRDLLVDHRTGPSDQREFERATPYERQRLEQVSQALATCIERVRAECDAEGIRRLAGGRLARHLDRRRHAPGPEAALREGALRGRGVHEHEVRTPVAEQVGSMRLRLDQGLSRVGGRKPGRELEHGSHPRQQSRRVEPSLHGDREPSRQQRRRARAQAVHDVDIVHREHAIPAARPGESLGKERQVGDEPLAEQPRQRRQPNHVRGERLRVLG
jgi:hypothetical protein